MFLQPFPITCAFADGSGNWNKKCCTVGAWCEQHSDPSRSFGRTKWQFFSWGTRLNLKHLVVAQNCVNGQHLILSMWFFSGRCILNNQRACIFLKSYSLAEKSPLRPKRFLFVMDSLKEKLVTRVFHLFVVRCAGKIFANTFWQPHFCIRRLKKSYSRHLTPA